MVKLKFPRKTLYLNIILCSLALSKNLAYAQDYFNPALLLNTEGSNIADLSNFEEGYQLPGNYRVNVYINDNLAVNKELNFYQTAKSDSVSGGLAPCIDSKWLLSLGVKVYDFPDQETLARQSCIDIKKYVPEASVNYNFNLQRLDMSIPQIWIRSDARGYIPPSEWDEGITAAYLNYNLNGNSSDKSDSVFVSLNSGFNIGGFRFRNFSTYNYMNHHTENIYRSRWNSVQNYVEKSIIPLKSELVIGDSTINNNIFESMGFRGVRLYSSEAMLPISMQGYAPVVRGIANSKSTITIRQNGYIVYQTNVNPGPFEINDLTSMALSGDLDVTVEETMGAIQHFIVPYSGIPMLLREGRLVFDLTAGQFRSGNRDQDNPTFFQGTLSRGLKNGVTVFGGTQIASKYRAGLLGIGKNMGHWGALSFDMTHANSTLPNHEKSQGQSYRLLYSKSLNELGTTIQILGYRYSTKGFYNLNEVAYKSMEQLEPEKKFDEFGNSFYDPSSYYNLSFTKKGRFQVSVNQNIGKYGSLYASANYQSYWNAPKDSKSYQIGYANAFKYFTLSLSWAMQDSPNIFNKKTNTIAASISMPLNAFFGKRDRVNNEVYSNSSVVRNSYGSNSIQTGLNGTLGEDRQFSYNVQQGRNSQTGAFGIAAAHVDTKYGSAGANYSFSDGGKDKSLNYDFSGGLILHSGGITFGQTLGDTNILIDAQGAKSVKVENSTNIYTDSRGYAIVPFAENYRLNRVALEADSMNEQTEILNNVQNLVPMKGAIVRARFDTRIGHRALITLKHLNEYLPYGSTITEESQKVSSIVGKDGQAYLSGLKDEGTLKISWGTSETENCNAKYKFDKDTSDVGITKLQLNCQ